MAFKFNLFSVDLHQRPKLACELSPEGVVAARYGEDGQPSMAFAALPAGSFSPGLKTPNLLDKPAVAAALRRALESLASRDKRLTIVVPDAAARILLLDFDTLPTKRSEALPVVRFRLRKLVPFDVDDASISYQVMEQTASQMRVLVTVIPNPVLQEYEEAVRLAGFEPGVVLPSTLASLASLTQPEPALVVNRNGNSLTTAITRGNELLLHRTLELPAESTLHDDDLRQAVSVSVAYFEDTLAMPPDSIFYAGTGGASELSRILAIDTMSEARTPEHVRVRDLAAFATAEAGSTIPKGLAAGVSGALAS